MITKRIILLIALLSVCGCKRKSNLEKFGPLLFQPQEKVCYIDDPELIGRVLGRNGFGQYRVQWRAISQHTGFLGGSVTSSPFTIRCHKSWELVSLEKHKD